MKSSVFCLFLVACLLVSLSFVNGFFDSADAYVGVKGVIDSDVTWTANGGPYSLTGNAFIDSGTTVTVEPGATVNLNEYYIRVNGSLILQPGVNVNFGYAENGLGHLEINGVLSAVGTSADPIRFNGATKHVESIQVPDSMTRITFEEASVDWNEQTGSGCIIQHSVMETISLFARSSLKFDNNEVNDCGFYVAGEKPVVSHNTFSGNVYGYSYNVGGQSPIITYNIFSDVKLTVDGRSPFITNNHLNGGLQLDGGSPFVANNHLNGGLSIYSTTNSATITSNDLSNGGIVMSVGYYYGYESILIEKNIIKDSPIGIKTVNSQAIDSQKPVTIRYNTITGNEVGISIGGNFQRQTITNNNLSNEINLQLADSASNDVNVPDNWWGTTETSAIEQSIMDVNDNTFEYDPDVGTVNYTPFLNSPDTTAPPLGQPISQAPISTPVLETPTPTIQAETPVPSDSSPFVLPTIDWGVTAIIILLAAVVALLVVNILISRRKQKQPLPPPPL